MIVLNKKYRSKKVSNIGRKFNIITLCGSIRFKEEFLKVKEKLTLEGNIVLTPNFFNNIKGKITTEMKKRLMKCIDRKLKCLTKFLLLMLMDILEKVQNRKLNMQ